MGKVHRIKKSFHKLLAQKPWETMPRDRIQYFQLARSGGNIGLVRIYIGVRWDRSWYIGHYGESYKPLMRKLIQEYQAGVAHSD